MPTRLLRKILYPRLRYGIFLQGLAVTLMNKHYMRDWLNFIRYAFKSVSLPAKAYMYTRLVSTGITILFLVAYIFRSVRLYLFVSQRMVSSTRDKQWLLIFPVGTASSFSPLFIGHSALGIG